MELEEKEIRLLANLVRLAKDSKRADCAIENFGITDIKEKISFLEKAFPNIKLQGRKNPPGVSKDDIEETDYWAFLAVAVG